MDKTLKNPDGSSADLIIVGAGASGLMASIVAARRDKRVLILEKMGMPARKLRITGKGRCNLTNVVPQSEFLKHIGPDARFLKNAFSRFFSEDLIAFLQEIGVDTVVEQGGRVFPSTERAQDVVDALVETAKRAGVRIITSSPVKAIVLQQGRVSGVVLESGEKLQASSVIIATGGCSYPATGSTGDGFRMARSLGHTVREAIPVLVPFETRGDLAQRLQGLALKNVQINVWMNGKKAGEAFGEMLFTHFGISGPIVLSLSRQFAHASLQGHQLEFSIDLKPALDHEKLDQRLLRDMDEHGKKSFQSLLKLLLPGSMVPVFIDLLGIPAEKPSNQINSNDRKKLRLLLKDLRFQISKPRGFEEAIVTAGGVSTKEIDPTSMESKLIPGLFFCGEVLDLDADTGGYNLQIAFSTGYVAGMKA